MAKVMNVVFGIGIALIIFIVVMLGTQVFYKAPVYEDFCNASVYNTPVMIYDTSMCTDNMTVGQCNLLVKEKQVAPVTEQQKYYDECQKKFTDADKAYGKNIFIVNNIAGIIAIVASLFLFGMLNIAAGTAFSGLLLILYGFMRGWQGTGDVLKFIVALIVAVLFIVFAVIVNKRYSKKGRRK